MKYAPTYFLLTLWVKLCFAVKIYVDSPRTRNIVGLRMIVYGLEEQEKGPRRPGESRVVRTAKLITEHVL